MLSEVLSDLWQRAQPCQVSASHALTSGVVNTLAHKPQQTLSTEHLPNNHFHTDPYQTCLLHISALLSLGACPTKGYMKKR